MPHFCPPHLLAALAWLNVVLHTAGLVLAAAGMRPGSALVDLADRQTYLASAPVGWSLGWGTWMLCTLALVAFLAAVARRLPGEPATARFAVALASAGGAVDLLCDVVYITVLPLVARGGASGEMLFLTIEQVAFAGGLVVANGLYSVAVLLVTACLHSPPLVTMPVLCLGYAVFLSGMVLAAAGFLSKPLLAEWATGPTIGLFCLWTVLVARSSRNWGNEP
jgi:hypothetical protein